MLILVTDIFGQTPWCEELVQTWRAKGHKALCINPYTVEALTDKQSVDHQYLDNASFDSKLFDRPTLKNEQQAYQLFQKSGGLDAYTKKVKQTLEQIITGEEQTITCVGFSAGAAALWQVAALNTIKLTHCIGFYPGQIRHSLELTPLCPFTLIFPESEQHFELEPVIQHLVTKQNTQILQVALKHGYANPQSDNVDNLASNELSQLLGLEHVDNSNLHQSEHSQANLKETLLNQQADFIAALNKLSHQYKERKNIN